MTQPRTNGHPAVAKIKTWIPGFDLIAHGGLPKERSTLITGTAGSGKTIFVTQFLAEGIDHAGEAGVFVTFEDAPEDIRRNVLGFGWDIAGWERDGKWAFVDGTPQAAAPIPVVGNFDLGALLSRIEHAVKQVGAKRIALDSMNALSLQIEDRALLRAEIFRIAARLKEIGLTVVFTGERGEDYGRLTRSGIEEFVADNVVVLRNVLADERRRRTIEILKFRGATHQRGEVPFTISDQGIVVIPLTALELTHGSSTRRVTSGVAELDRMCGGGFFRNSVILISGATGTGKTLLVTQFLAGGYAKGERVLLFAFEESRDQLFRNAASWGMDFAGMEKEGKLRAYSAYPHAKPMEDHLIQMHATIDEFKPQRVAVDSLSALERVFTLRGYREFVTSLTSRLKKDQMTGLFTATTASLLGGGSVTEKHISTLTDSIILLRYVELEGQMRRSLTVLKMRGSAHDHDIRELTIDHDGMHIGGTFRGVMGILSGNQFLLPDSSVAGVGEGGQDEVERTEDFTVEERRS